jgi:hypothetical protein
VRNIFFAASEKIIKAQQAIATSNQFIAQVRPQKSSAASDEYLFNFSSPNKKAPKTSTFFTYTSNLLNR